MNISIQRTQTANAHEPMARTMAEMTAHLGGKGQPQLAVADLYASKWMSLGTGVARKGTA